MKCSEVSFPINVFGLSCFALAKMLIKVRDYLRQSLEKFLKS